MIENFNTFYNRPVNNTDFSWHRNQSALMQRIRSPGTLWKSNNRFCICSFFHLMISTSLLLPLIIGNVAVGGTTIPIGNRMVDVISIYPVRHINLNF